MEPLTIRRLREFNQLRALTRDWAGLWHRCGSASPFQRAEWLLPWAEVFTPGSWCIVEARRGGCLVGLAPMFIYSRGGERVLAPIGAGITDYLDWLVDPAEGSECIKLLQRELATADWDVMEIMDLPSGSILVREALNTGWTPEVCDTCPALRFPAGATVNQVVPRHQRRNLKTARNRIARVGSWQLELANRHTLPEFLETLFHLHSARWTELGEPGVLADARVREFHLRSAPLLFESGLLRFLGIRFEGRLIAALHSLVGRDTVYCYLQGFDSAYGEFSPGMLLLEAVISDAIGQGKCGVDFLRGKEAYKYSWGARDEETYRIRAANALELTDAVARRAA